MNLERSKYLIIWNGGSMVWPTCPFLNASNTNSAVVRS